MIYSIGFDLSPKSLRRGE